MSPVIILVQFNCYIFEYCNCFPNNFDQGYGHTIRSDAVLIVLILPDLGHCDVCILRCMSVGHFKSGFSVTFYLVSICARTIISRDNISSCLCCFILDLNRSIISGHVLRQVNERCYPFVTFISRGLIRTLIFRFTIQCYSVRFAITTSQCDIYAFRSDSIIVFIIGPFLLYLNISQCVVVCIGCRVACISLLNFSGN